MSNLTIQQELKHTLQKMGPQFAAALPSHVKTEKFVRVVMTAVSTNPQLCEASRPSLFSACMSAAQDGLLPDGKEAAMVTFKTKSGHTVAQYMPMVAGILKKVRNSGELASITSQIVYEKDEFEFYVDEDGEHLKHRPLIFGERGKPIGVYALAKTKDGAVYIETLTADDVEKIKNVSRGKNGPWSGPFQLEMWRKSAIRRLSKRLPMSTDLEHTITADDELYDLDQSEDKHEEKKETPKTPTNLKEKLKTVSNNNSNDEEPPPPEEENPPIDTVAEQIPEEEVPV